MTASVTDINEWRVDHKCAEVVSLHGDGAPENVTPTRKHFGKRAPSGREVFGWDRRPDVASLQGGISKAWEAATESEKRGNDALAAEFARDAWRAFGKKRQGSVCPSLLIAAAGEANAIAEASKRLADKLLALGSTQAARSFYEIHELCETVAAVIEHPTLTGDDQ